jgi:beta propeller repeat protein
MKQSRNCLNLVICAAIILTYCIVIPAIAVGTETLISSNASADQAKPVIYGNYIVWVDSRYVQDIYLYNTVTLQEYRITDGSALVDSPDIQGDRVVWVQGGKDIYWYDIAARSVHKVPLDTSSRFTPRISGNRIVWMEQQEFTSGFHNDILMYDIGTNLTHNLTAGQPDTDQEKPAISGNIVVWEDHRLGYPEYDIYGIDTTSGDPATWIEKPVCTEIMEQTSPAIYGDIVVWQDSRTYIPHIHSAHFNTTVDFWNSSNDDSGVDNQFSPSVYGDTIVWVDTWPDYNTYIGMYNSTSNLKTEPLTVPSISSDGPPRIYQNRVVWGDTRTGPSQVYLYTDGVSITCPVAELMLDNSTVTPGETVTFFDKSTPIPDTWFWEFGDGTVSTDQNPHHAYANPGTYTVMLSVGNTSCRSTTPFGSYQVSVAAIPVVDFDAAPQTGMAPLTVTFNGFATGNPALWNWDFGDSSTGTGQNISHTYDVGGTYNVRLNATNAIGTGTKFKTGYIHVLSGAHEIISTDINGITVDNRFLGQFLTYDSGLLPDFSLSGSELVSHPPLGSGWQNVTFLTSDITGFFSSGATLTGNLTGIIFHTKEIRPDGFSQNLGSSPGVSYKAAMSSYPAHAALTIDIWESATASDNLTYLNVIHQNGFSNLNALAYTMNISRSNFGTSGDCSINMSVGTDWVAGFEGITEGRNTTYIIATGYDTEGNYYGIVLPATYRHHDLVTNLDYFTSDIPARYSFLSKFSLAKLSGSGNVFQLFTISVASRVIPSSGGSTPVAVHGGGSGGGSVPIAVQNTQSPEIKPPEPPDPGKTAKIYANNDGVVTQETTLQSTDGLAAVIIPEGFVVKDSTGNPLSSITIKAIPKDSLPALPAGSAVAFNGMGYELEPDGATFSPSIAISFTIRQARWGQEYIIKTYDPTSGTWQDVSTTYNPGTGLASTEMSHFCYIALFTKAVAPTPSVTMMPASTPVPVVEKLAPSPLSRFLGMIEWVTGMVTKNALIAAGIVILIIALLLFGRRIRRNRAE